MVRLLDVDPDLGGLLTDTRREHAERELVVRTHRLPVGPWDVSRLAGATADHVGLLIIDGILSRELVVADHVSAELLGPGDLVRPWQPTSRTGLLPVDAVWTVLSPLTVAVLDRRFAAEMTRYPEITAALFDRLSERSLRLATTQAISQLTRVDRRLKALFWHLAERWGRVSGDGVIVPLALTHRILGQLVGARRPTVSTALSELAEREELIRRPDGSWLLRGDPPDAESLARKPGPGEPSVFTRTRPDAPGTSIRPRSRHRAARGRDRDRPPARGARTRRSCATARPPAHRHPGALPGSANASGLGSAESGACTDRGWSGRRADPRRPACAPARARAGHRGADLRESGGLPARRGDADRRSARRRRRSRGDHQQPEGRLGRAGRAADRGRLRDDADARGRPARHGRDLRGRQRSRSGPPARDDARRRAAADARRARRRGHRPVARPAADLRQRGRRAVLRAAAGARAERLLDRALRERATTSATIRAARSISNGCPGGSRWPGSTPSRSPPAPCIARPARCAGRGSRRPRCAIWTAGCGWRSTSSRTSPSSSAPRRPSASWPRRAGGCRARSTTSARSRRSRSSRCRRSRRRARSTLAGDDVLAGTLIVEPQRLVVPMVAAGRVLGTITLSGAGVRRAGRARRRGLRAALRCGDGERAALPHRFGDRGRAAAGAAAAAPAGHPRRASWPRPITRRGRGSRSAATSTTSSRPPRASGTW